MTRREKIEGESGSEYLVQEREDFLRGGVVDFTHPLYQAYFVDGADLVQDDLSGFSLESDRNPRVGYSRPCVVMGATMTVPM
jgi:hypothetical protein